MPTGVGGGGSKTGWESLGNGGAMNWGGGGGGVWGTNSKAWETTGLNSHVWKMEGARGENQARLRIFITLSKSLTKLGEFRNPSKFLAIFLMSYGSLYFRKLAQPAKTNIGKFK